MVGLAASAQSAMTPCQKGAQVVESSRFAAPLVHYRGASISIWTSCLPRRGGGGCRSAARHKPRQTAHCARAAQTGALKASLDHRGDQAGSNAPKSVADHKLRARPLIFPAPLRMEWPVHQHAGGLARTGADSVQAAFATRHPGAPMLRDPRLRLSSVSAVVNHPAPATTPGITPQTACTPGIERDSAQDASIKAV